MKKLKVLELFAGTRGISRAFEARGHETYSIEWDEQHEGIDWYTDINDVTADDILERFGQPDVIWASPDCTTYSIAGIYHHRKKAENGELLPTSERAIASDKLNKHMWELIKELNPQYYFVENPRGGMRKMSFVADKPMYTVTYCQYGDDRMKPTDLWTNHPRPNFRPMCKNGDPCHVSAPRGSRTGTQGLVGTVLRSMIPDELTQQIAEISEDIPYNIIDINGHIGEEEVVETTTLEGIRDFLENSWANHVDLDDEVVEVPNYDGFTIDELQGALEGIGYFAEEADGYLSMVNEKENE